LSTSFPGEGEGRVLEMRCTEPEQPEAALVKWGLQEQILRSAKTYKGALRRSQFAPVLNDAQGTFRNPRGW